MLLGGTHGESESNAEEHAHFGAEDIGWQALGPAIACTMLATAVVAARWFTRHRLAQCVGLDDYVIVLSLTLSWAMTALIGAEVNGGTGVFAGPVTATTIAQLVVASNVLWILIVNITKASILAQYLCIFSSPRIRQTCYFFLLLLLPAASWAVFGGIFLCTPTAKLWRPELEGHCIDAQKYWISVAGIDIGLDFLILLLPLPAITGLRLPRKQKVGLVLVFTLGFLVCAVSVIRLLTVLISAREQHFVLSGVWAIIWSSAEANVGIICASLLSLKPLVAKIFPRLMEETKPARHSLRIGMIETGDVWRDETTRVYPKLRSSIAKPSSSRSRDSGAAMRISGDAVRNGSMPALSQVENVTVIEPEYPPATWRQVGSREGVNLFDMLREDKEEARAYMLRKNSSFTEHL